VVYLRWALTAAAAAFIISIGLGIVSGVIAIFIILRAVIFAVLFFGIGFALRFIISTFFPEVLFMSSEPKSQSSQEQETSHSITIDATGEYAVPELYKSPGSANELGNIEDLISGIFRPRTSDDDESSFSAGIDRKEEEGYNKIGQGVSKDNIKSSGTDELESINFRDMFQDTAGFDEPGIQEIKQDKPAFTPSFGYDSDGLGGLPDLDTMAMAFGGAHTAPAASSSYSGSVSDSSPIDFGESDSLQSHYVGNKPQPLKGDFNPKELAEGIRTVLTKEK